jgi:hypothetical protein
LIYQHFFAAFERRTADSSNAFNHLAKACPNDAPPEPLAAMEVQMRIRIFAIGAVLNVSVAAAQPVSNDSHQPAPTAKPAHVVLASADQPRPPAPDAAQPAPAPIKHRVGRVTTCRCGDPQPEPETPEQ